MAYGLNYTIRFTNRIQNDTFRIEIYQRDYAESTITELTGAETPVIISYQDGELLDPIKASELTFSFNADFSALDTFYSDDDERYRVDYYYEDVSDVLLWSGYLIQDGVSEPITDIKHPVTLKATDNLALLKNTKLNEAGGDDLYGKHTLLYYIQICLAQTGLYSPDSVIDQSLPLRTYVNIFENTTDDRSDADTNDPLNETVLHSNVFQNSDNTWDDCYTVLEKILTDLNASLLQVNGAWVIVRTPEYKFFDNAIPGTEYIYNGVTTDITAVTLDEGVTIDRTGADVYPIAEDQNKSIQRPLKRVFNTFNYNQPAFIKNTDLQLPDGATPFDTNTAVDLRYDDYNLGTYFPDWIQRGTVTSYLEVVTDTAVTPEQEKDRYIVIIGDDSLTGGVQFNPIEVTKGDKLDFTLQWRTDTDTDDLIRFWVRFVLISTTNTDYNLTDQAGGSNDEFRWVGPSVSADLWDLGLGIYKEMTNPNNVDTTEWMQWSLSDSQWSTDAIPVIPVDGVLLIEVRGTNAGSETDRQNVYFKDIVLTFTQYVNQSTQIVGQTHKDTGTETNKAISESDLNIDDSPRNIFAGTLFTNAQTNFDYTDSTTGQDTEIGNLYFTKTYSWHRGDSIEELRLGNIVAFERLYLKYISRLIIEGTFRNLRHDDTKFITMLSVFSFGWITDKFFLATGMEIDYMDCSFKAKLIEIYGPDSSAVAVFMAGTKEEQLTVFTDVIHFDTITYYGGADGYITVTGTNSTFTYSNAFDTTIILSVIFFVPISGSGTATFTIEKNGIVIATQTLNAAAMFGHISFDLTEPVTNGDYFQAFVDTGGADVDIQSGSINITVNDVESMVNFPYQFNYLYKTD